MNVIQFRIINSGDLAETRIHTYIRGELARLSHRESYMHTYFEFRRTRAFAFKIGLLVLEVGAFFCSCGPTYEMKIEEKENLRSTGKQSLFHQTSYEHFETNCISETVFFKLFFFYTVFKTVSNEACLLFQWKLGK